MYVVKQNLANQKIFFPLDHEDYGTVTVTFRDYNGNELYETSGTVADFSLTTEEACGSGTEEVTRVEVDNASGASRIPVFLISPEGYSEKLHLKGIDTTLNIISFATYPQNYYDEGSEVKAAQGYVTVPSDVYSTEQKFYVIFSYLSDGKLISWQDSGYVHRNPAGNPVSMEQLYRKFPSLREQQYTGDKGHIYTNLLDITFDEVRARLYNTEKMIEMYKGSVEALKQVIFAEFSLKLMEQGVIFLPDTTATEAYEIFRTEKIEAWEKLNNTALWVDYDDDDVDDDGEEGRGTRLIF